MKDKKKVIWYVATFIEVVLCFVALFGFYVMFKEYGWMSAIIPMSVTVLLDIFAVFYLKNKMKKGFSFSNLFFFKGVIVLGVLFFFLPMLLISDEAIARYIEENNNRGYAQLGSLIAAFLEIVPAHVIAFIEMLKK